MTPSGCGLVGFDEGGLGYLAGQARAQRRTWDETAKDTQQFCEQLRAERGWR